MNKAFEKLLAKKKAMGDEMPKQRMDARSSVLDDLMSNMDGRQSDKLGMKKVSVMSNSKEGLQSGLDKAKDALSDESPEDAEHDMDGMDSSDEDEQSEDEQDPDNLAMHGQHEEMDKEQMQAEIEMLKAKLAKLGM